MKSSKASRNLMSELQDISLSLQCDRKDYVKNDIQFLLTS